MVALSYPTSKIFPNRRSDWYTPGLHGCPSTSLIGTCNSKPLLSRCTSTSKLTSLAGLSLLRVDFQFCQSNFISLTWVGARLFALPPTVRHAKRRRTRGCSNSCCRRTMDCVFLLCTALGHAHCDHQGPCHFRCCNHTCNCLAASFTPLSATVDVVFLLATPQHC